MEMSEKEQIFGILCGTVDRLLGKKEYEIITSLYDNLLKYKLIHSIEDFKAGKVIEGSMKEALIYWIWRALVQAKAKNNDTTMTEEKARALFEAENENIPF
jgi:hypothetical protein